MANTARFDSFHSTFDTSVPSAVLSRHTHLFWVVIATLAGIAAVVMTFFTFQSIDPMVAGLMDNLSSVTHARNANGFFTLPAVN
ncbi:hypothetical protein [Roseicyclus mahoneyensis]|jgi:hypothetical protein|uniref:Uncharacterized protein n=1 Tax=Roseicyclus mahoneyensis TaxID=164332 RepID=A0A316GZ67_9RHOB|nr:hypothetical protein [Roseicyclus mahoneyensis]PWK60429.1 hypothetical protein C7455_10465 [Roseicyclus mahoneyensis]